MNKKKVIISLVILAILILGVFYLSKYIKENKINNQNEGANNSLTGNVVLDIELDGKSEKQSFFERLTSIFKKKN